MKINNETWILGCNSLVQKQELLAYAKTKGIKQMRSACRDNELAIGWNGLLNELYSFSLEWLKEPDCTPISPDKFKAMCDEYAQPFKPPRKTKKRLKAGLLSRIDNQLICFDDAAHALLTRNGCLQLFCLTHGLDLRQSYTRREIRRHIICNRGPKSAHYLSMLAKIPFTDS